MKRNLLLLFAIIPPIILGLLVWRYSVNIPFFDQWDTPGRLIIERSQRALSWSDWLQQHTESRPVFPKLLFLTLADLTNWNTRYEMLVTFLLACLISCNIYRLSSITFIDKAKHFTCFLLTNLFIFSPIQQENWMWGFQSINFASIVAITTSFVVIFSRIPWLIKLVVSLILSIVATFSFANGILCWIIIFPALLFKCDRDKIKKVWLVFSWLFAFSLSISLYFYGYFTPDNSSKIMEVFTQPILALKYYLGLLGTPIFPHDLLGSQIVGAIILFAFLYLCFYFWNQRANIGLIDRAFPWLLIGFYVLLSAALITTGRISFGIESSLTQRYITFSTYLTIALIYLATIFFQSVRKKTLKRVVFSVLLIFFLITYKDNYITGVKWITKIHYERVHGKACVLTIDLIRDLKCISDRVYPRPNTWEEPARKINSLGLLDPAIPKNIDWQTSNQKSNGDRINIYGEFNNFSLAKNGSYIASGWLFALPSKPSFDAVILTYQATNQPQKAFAIAELNVDNNDLLELFINPQKIKLTWNKNISTQETPPSNSYITAWAFDTDNAKAYPLQNIHQVTN